MSDSLLPHELQHARPPCPSPTPEVHSDSRPSSHEAIQPSHPLSSTSPPAPNPSQHQSLSNESTLRMRWPKYWSFSISIIPSREIPGLISFRMDCLDLLAHSSVKLRGMSWGRFRKTKTKGQSSAWRGHFLNNPWAPPLCRYLYWNHTEFYFFFQTLNFLFCLRV